MRQTFDEQADPSFGRQHLPLIRAEMQRQGLDALVIPHEDEHQNEYLPAANERLAWATGFTGSAGAAVILKDAAAVFVDGRYTLQVKKQVDPTLFEAWDLVEGGVPKFIEERTAAGQVIGYDPRLHSADALGHLRNAAARTGAVLKPVEQNPVDRAWDGRPDQPRAAVLPHGLDYAGEASADKRARVGQAIGAAGADVAVLTAPASIAWLFNIRGGDVIRSPLPLGQAILRRDGTARLFLDPAKVGEDLPAWLGDEVSLEPPEALQGALAETRGVRVLVDPAVTSAWYFDRLAEAGATVVRAQTPPRSPAPARTRRRSRARAGRTAATGPRWRGSCTGWRARRRRPCPTRWRSWPGWRRSGRRRGR